MIMGLLNVRTLTYTHINLQSISNKVLTLNWNDEAKLKKSFCNFQFNWKFKEAGKGAYPPHCNNLIN